jgi:hypothetical protein
MPYLNWKERPIALGARTRPGPAHAELTELDVAFGPAERDELLAQLAGVFARFDETAPFQPELRIDLPQGWALFFKLREGESRLLLAHPEAEVWVATLALDSDHAARFLRALPELAAADAGAALRLSELAPVARVSNCELVLRLG